MSNSFESTASATTDSNQDDRNLTKNGKRRVSDLSVENNHSPLSGCSSDPVAKRPCNDEDETEILDLAETFGFKAGDRFEVQWEIHPEGYYDEDADEAPETQSHWWGATLLEYDGRTKDSVAIRVLDYDPFPEGGFPERSKEDVIFFGKDTLVNPETHEELTYRVEGEDSGAIWMGKQGVEEVVNATLEKALEKNSAAWKNLTSAQQAQIAATIAEKKEKLLDLLLNHERGVITSDIMKSILAKTMES